MMVAILVIGYVLVLRYLDQKSRQKERLKLGGVQVGPVDYESLKKSLGELSDRLAGVEAQYRELARRMGGAQ